MKSKGPDEYGEMQTASLTVSGPVVPGTIYYGTDAAEVWRTAPTHPDILRKFDLKTCQSRREGRLDTWEESEVDDDHSFAPPEPSNASKDAELGDNDFNVVVGNHAMHWHPDYAIQKSGEDYVESGTAVLCLIATKDAFLVLRCVDSDLGHYERIGLYSRPEVIDDWLKQASIVELVLV
jgi:hypothetical protein